MMLGLATSLLVIFPNVALKEFHQGNATNDGRLELPSSAVMRQCNVHCRSYVDFHLDWKFNR